MIADVDDMADGIACIPVTAVNYLRIEEGNDYEDEALLPYEAVKKLGHGSSGTVEKVLDRNTGTVYARKTFLIRPVRHQRVQSNVFGNELRSIRSLGTHIHIVSVFATYTTKEELGMILEPVAESDLAGTLLTYLEAKQSSDGLRLKQLTSVLERAFGCLISALAFIHKKSIRHKDIKPENILVHNGAVVYIDFGSSYLAGPLQGSSSSGPPGGVTRRYCAPECDGTSKRNSKSDVYSLGCVFVEILFALTLAISCDNVQSFSKEMDKLHEQLDNSYIILPLKIKLLSGIIKSMTSRSVQERPTANDLCCDILCGSMFGCAECRGQLEAYQKVRDERKEEVRKAKAAATAETAIKRKMKAQNSQPVSTPGGSASTALTTQKTSRKETTSMDNITSSPSSRGMARVGTRAKEGSAINQLRVFLHEKGIELPWHIEKALNDFHDLRDRLGLIEAHDIEAEEEHNMPEFQHTQNEMGFIEDVLNDEPPPMPLPRSMTPVAEMRDLTGFAFGSPDHSDVPEPTSQQQPVALSSGLPEQTQPQPNRSSPTVHRATSVPSHHSLAPSERLYSDESPSYTVSGWSMTKMRIDLWLLDMISSSPLQQAQLKAMDPKDTGDQTIWWQQLVEYWRLDTSASNRFHIGDSTVAHDITSRESSAADLDVSDIMNIDLDTVQHPPLLPEERVVDALEESNIPPSIESGDLREIGQNVDVDLRQQEHKAVDTTSYGSTGPANTHRTLSSDDLASVITIDQVCFCANCTGLQSNLVEGMREHEFYSVSTFDNTLNLDPDHITQPPSPKLFPADPPEPLFQFPFPILQLAPVTMTPGPDNSHKLDIYCLPFVSFQGAPLHLPGPTAHESYN